MAIIVATESNLPPWRTFTYVASIHRYGQPPSRGRSRNAFTRSSISSQSRDIWLFEMPVIPNARTRSSTERVEMPCTYVSVKRHQFLRDKATDRLAGRPESHPYELLLAMEDVEHRTTKVRSPRTNGFVERMNRTLLDKCFRVAGRQTWYVGIGEIQRDLDVFMEHYNLARSHQGYRLKGRTPAQALRDVLGLSELPSLAFRHDEPTAEEDLPATETAD
jgi:hypothetical protein